MQGRQVLICIALMMLFASATPRLAQGSRAQPPEGFSAEVAVDWFE